MAVRTRSRSPVARQRFLVDHALRARGQDARAWQYRQEGGAPRPGVPHSVQYYDVARLSGDAEDALGVRFALFPEPLQSSDIVSLHVPLDASARNLIGAREPGLTKPTVMLINTCRGPVVDEDALYDALISDRIRGTGLG
jgi:lactate dehydrogenase-like 2-hydroxyacid dehydrogenase